MKIDKDTMLEILDGDINLGKIIQDKIIDHSRWSIVHEIIFEYQGKLYQTDYSVGATETQDEGPWEYEKKVECWEVQKVEKRVIVYEVKE